MSNRVATLKLVAVVVLAVLCIVIVLQNTETVSTRVLWVQVDMPRALLLFLTALIGFIAGVTVSVFANRGRAKKHPEKRG